MKQFEIFHMLVQGLISSMATIASVPRGRGRFVGGGVCADISDRRKHSMEIVRRGRGRRGSPEQGEGKGGTQGGEGVYMAQYLLIN